MAGYSESEEGYLDLIISRLYRQAPFQEVGNIFSKYASYET
jgi:hypothetical protein